VKWSELILLTALGEGRWRVLLVLAVPLFMVLLDVTIVNIAVPIMSASTWISSIEWMINIYVLVLRFCSYLGRLGDLYGRKFLFSADWSICYRLHDVCHFSSFSFFLASRVSRRWVQRHDACYPLYIECYFSEKAGPGSGNLGRCGRAANALGPVLACPCRNYSWRAIFL